MTERAIREFAEGVEEAGVNARVLGDLILEDGGMSSAQFRGVEGLGRASRGRVWQLGVGDSRWKVELSS